MRAGRGIWGEIFITQQRNKKLRETVTLKGHTERILEHSMGNTVPGFLKIIFKDAIEIEI